MLLFVQFFVGVICYLHCSLLFSLLLFHFNFLFFPFLPSSSFSFLHSTLHFFFSLLNPFPLNFPFCHSFLSSFFLYPLFLLTSSLPDLFSYLFTLSYFLLFSPPFTGSFTFLFLLSYSLNLSVSFSLFFLPCTSLSLPYIFSFTDSFWQLFLQFFSIYLVAIKITVAEKWPTTNQRPYKQIPMNHIWVSSCVHISHILTKIFYFYINMLHSSSKYLLCLYRFLRYRHWLSYNLFITLLFR